MVQMLSIQAEELDDGARIIKTQLTHKNPIWIQSILSRNIGGNVSDLVHDVCRLELTGRQHENTWAPAGDHDAQRCSRNTTGYQVKERSTQQDDMATDGWYVHIIFQSDASREHLHDLLLIHVVLKVASRNSRTSSIR